MLLVRMIFIKLKTHHCMPCLKFFCIPLFLEKPALKACKIIPNMVPAPSSSELQFYTLLLSSMELVSVPQWSIPGMDLCLFPLSPKFIFWSPIHPQCDSFRRWGLRKVISHEDRALVNGISTCVRRRSTCFVSLLSVVWRHQEEMAICKLGGGTSPESGSATTLILDFPVCRTERNNCIV